MKSFIRVAVVGCLLAVVGAIAAPAATDSVFVNNWIFKSPGSVEMQSTKNKGSHTLSGATGTVTVKAGSVCVCSEQTDITKLVKCSVSATTLTITGTTTDVISYICL
mgnify:CR=1 FL=1